MVIAYLSLFVSRVVPRHGVDWNGFRHTEKLVEVLDAQESAGMSQ